jgi:hypothetical protein
MKQRILHLLIAIDQLIYVIITLGHGNPDETMSAAAWRLEKKGHCSGKLFRPLIDWLLWFDPDHCRTSYEAEVYRAKVMAERYTATKEMK